MGKGKRSWNQEPDKVQELIPRRCLTSWHLSFFFTFVNCSYRYLIVVNLREIFLALWMAGRGSCPTDNLKINQSQFCIFVSTYSVVFGFVRGAALQAEHFEPCRLTRGIDTFKWLLGTSIKHYREDSDWHNLRQITAGTVRENVKRDHIITDLWGTWGKKKRSQAS